MKYRLAIFDLDGTILDTLEDLTDSTNYALRTNNLPARTLDEIRTFVGNGIRNLIEKAVPEGTDADITEKVFREFGEHYKVHCLDKTKPYEGILQCIRSIREAGMMTAVVSNKADYAVRELCEKIFPGLYDIAVGEKQGVRRKPYPDSVVSVLDSLSADREEAVYIGDSEVDIQTALNAGIDEIAVSWGFRKKEFLKEQGAEIVTDSPEELLEILSGAE